MLWGRLAVAVLAPAVALNMLWAYHLGYERRNTTARLQQIASGDETVRREALDAIRRLGPCAAPTISKALTNPDRKMRKVALLASPEVLGNCLGVLSEMNCFTGFIPGRAAAHRGFQELVAALNQALLDEDEEIRLEAARTLSNIHDSRP